MAVEEEGRKGPNGELIFCILRLRLLLEIDFLRGRSISCAPGIPGNAPLILHYLVEVSLTAVVASPFVHGVKIDYVNQNIKLHLC